MCLSHRNTDEYLGLGYLKTKILYRMNAIVYTFIAPNLAKVGIHKLKPCSQNLRTVHRKFCIVRIG